MSVVIKLIPNQSNRRSNVTMILPPLVFPAFILVIYIFVGKARSLFIRVGYTRPFKYKTRVKVNDVDKHYSLLQCGINYSRKRFYSTGSRVCVTINLQS